MHGGGGARRTAAENLDGSTFPLSGEGCRQDDVAQPITDLRNLRVMCGA